MCCRGLLFLVLASCGQQTAVVPADDTAELEDELSSRVQCFPKKALAYPGDRVMMRANKTVTWSATDGDIAEDATFTAPSHTGTVTITATAGSSYADCKIKVVSRPHTNPGDGAGASLSVHTSLGIPSPANSSHTHYLVEKSDYVISYNGETRSPNWVSWEMNGTYLGGFERKDRWHNDEDTALAQGTDDEYYKSGYDRGHMCPSADRSKDSDLNYTTFVYTNAVPQVPASNRGPWAQLETYLQNLAADGHEIFVIAGPIGSLGTMGDVTIPEAVFKIAVVLDRLGDRAPDVTSDAQVIAVMMPNDDSIQQSDSWHSYEVRVRDVERATGFDFLSDVDSDVQDSLE